jgi:hypothetical protein
MLNEHLQRQLREAIGPDRFGAMGELTDWRLGLVGEIDTQGLTGRVRTLCPRLSRPESAMALALNSFLPWRGHIDGLRLCGANGFTELHFDGRCPTGVRGTPPHVDVIAAGSGGVVGACVRVFDYLGSRRPSSSSAYRTLAVEKGMASWVAVLQEAAAYRHLDVAGLAKVAIGLGRIFTRRPVALLYLFLEPAGATAPAFVAHRAELDRVIERTSGSTVTLTGRSLHELWDEWCSGDTPAAVRTTAAELCRRYGVAMPASARA